MRQPPSYEPTYASARRVLQLVAMLSDTRTGLTQKEIAERLEVSTKTAERYLKAISDHYGERLSGHGPAKKHTANRYRLHVETFAKLEYA